MIEIHMNQNSFIHMHGVHILETALALAVIAAWWHFRNKRH